MKFQVGDEVYFQHIKISGDDDVGVIIECDINRNSRYPYKVKFDNETGICMEEELTLTQACKNEQKLKKVLGL